MLHFQRITIIYWSGVCIQHECAAILVAGRWDIRQMLCTFIMNCAFVWTQIVPRLLSGSRIIVQEQFKSKHKPAATTPSVRHIFLARCAAYLYTLRERFALEVCHRQTLIFVINSWCLKKKLPPTHPPQPPTPSSQHY